MPRRGAVALLLTTAALALLLAFKTPSEPAAATGGETQAVTGAIPSPLAGVPGTTAAPTAPAGAEATPAPQAAATPAPTKAPGGTYRDGTLTGSVVATRWGAVQVQITIAGGAISDVTALKLPDGDRHSAQLSQRAEPRLRSSALAAQSANVDIVSGATYTSRAYAQSLQAALDAARA